MSAGPSASGADPGERSSGPAGGTAVAFEKTRAEGRSALVGYLPAGFPSVAGGIAAIRAMVEAGADLVEVGLPYSDPVMDGPVIQRASEAALAGGVRTADVLHTVEAVADAGAPALVMTYWAPIERYGGNRSASSAQRVDRFARDLAAAGGAGLITPDLIPDEADDWLAASDAHGLDRVFLVAPSSTDQRLAATVAACRGFVYAAALMGVTGARERSSEAAPALVSRVRAARSGAAATGEAAVAAAGSSAGAQATDLAGASGELPVGVGLGVSNGSQAAAVAGYADAVIVGSALVSRLLDAPDEAAGRGALQQLTREFAIGVRS